MAHTPEQANQRILIEQYLAGWPLPSQAPRGPRPPALPFRNGTDQWMRELADDPYLYVAEDILDAALPSAAYAPPARQPVRKPTAAKRSLWKSVSNIIFYAALAAIALCAVIFGSQSTGGTRFRYQYFEVLSPSMQSVIPKGSLVITKKTPPDQIKAGDIITYLRSDEQNITHQVIEVIPNFDGMGTLGFRTKGTENAQPDPDIVGAANVIGVVKAHVKELGFALHYISDNIKYLFVAFLIIILISIAIQFLLGERKKTRVHQPQKGCGHIKYNGRRENPPEERMIAQCKRQKRAA